VVLIVFSSVPAINICTILSTTGYRKNQIQNNQYHYSLKTAMSYPISFYLLPLSMLLRSKLLPRFYHRWVAGSFFYRRPSSISGREGTTTHHIIVCKVTILSVTRRLISCNYVSLGDHQGKFVHPWDKS